MKSELRQTRFYTELYPQLKERLKRTNLKAYRFIETYVVLDKMPESCFIEGTVGSTKTTYAIWLMFEYARHMALEGRRMKLSQLCYITMEGLLQSLKETYNEPGACEIKLVKYYQTVPFLLLDDLYAGKTTDWGHSHLTSILDHRYNMELTTIMTSNLRWNEIQEKVDERLFDRVRGIVGGNIIVMDGESKR